MAKKKVTDEVEDDGLAIDIAKLIDKKYGKNVMMPGTYLIENPKKVFHISPNFDAECGGVPEGSLITLSSPSGFGKTTLALTIARVLQNDGRKIFYIDAENRLKPMNLQGIKGLKAEEVNVIRSTEEIHLSAEDNLQIATDILKNHKRICLIVDSASALCPASEITNDVSSTIRNTSPKMFANFCRKNSGNISANNNVLIVIKHVINNTSGWGAKHIEDGGEKLKFQADIRLMATDSPEKIIEGDKAVGHIIEWNVLKSATGQSNVTFRNYVRYGIGIDEISEIIEIAQDYGLIDKKGAWFYLDSDTELETKYQGITKLRDYLTENEEAYKRLLKQVQDMPK